MLTFTCSEYKQSAAKRRALGSALPNLPGCTGPVCVTEVSVGSMNSPVPATAVPMQQLFKSTHTHQ